MVHLKKERKKEKERKATVVAQWKRICLLMSETSGLTLLQEDPICHRASKPVCAQPLSLLLQSLGATALSPCSTTGDATTMRSLHTAIESTTPSRLCN